MSNIKSILLFCGLGSFLTSNSQQNYIIPKQTFQPYKILGFQEQPSYAVTSIKTDQVVKIDSFEISHLITLKAYKEYLEKVKKDSSFDFYLKQLPDSTITSAENYKTYISSKKYEAFPAVGISWEAAINYCKWRTLKENNGADIKFIYRLPILGEWLVTYNYLEANKSTHDLSKNYSDWTMNDYYEAIIGFKSDSTFVYDGFLGTPAEKDHPRDKRKIAMGDSYLFQHERLRQHFFGYYSFNGYRQIGFRLVKEPVKENMDTKSLAKKIIIYWGIGKIDQQ